MTNEYWEDIEHELQQGTGYFRPSGPKTELQIGESCEITLVSVSKYTDTKYPVMKNKQSLGYTWRFVLSDGRVWDVSNANRIELLRHLFPNRADEPHPARFQVTNVGQSINKKPAVTVRYLGPAA